MTFTIGAWPVMLTPFTADDRVDGPALDRYVDWLVARGRRRPVPGGAVGRDVRAFSRGRLAIARGCGQRPGLPVAAAALDGIRGTAGVGVVDLAAAGCRRRRARGAGVQLGAQAEDEQPGPMALDRAVAPHGAVPDVALGIYECPLPHHRS